MQDNSVQDNMTAPLLMNALKCSLPIYARKVKPALGLLRARVCMDQTFRNHACTQYVVMHGRPLLIQPIDGISYNYYYVLAMASKRKLRIAARSTEVTTFYYCYV